MRFFTTSGPVVAHDHYCIPPLDRLNLSAVRRFVREKRYFVLHAPRQTGKTSVLLTLRDLLNAEGAYRCVYVNVEGGQAGHLVVFDRGGRRRWSDKVFHDRRVADSGMEPDVWGM